MEQKSHDIKTDFLDICSENSYLKTENNELIKVLVDWGEIIYNSNKKIKTQKNEIDCLNIQLDNLTKNISLLKEQYENVSNNFEELLNEKNSLQIQCQYLLNENVQLRNFNEEILDSNSWKITKPLRFFKKIFNMR